MIAENTWKPILDFLGNLVEKVAIESILDAAPYKMVGCVIKINRRLKAEIPQPLQRCWSKKIV